MSKGVKLECRGWGGEIEKGFSDGARTANLQTEI